MSTKSGTITVTDAAVDLLTIGGIVSKPGSDWTAYNPGPGTIWTGDKSVQVGQGIPIPPEGYAEKTLKENSTLFGITDDDTNLNVMLDGV